jgi:hypothetical protein
MRRSFQPAIPAMGVVLFFLAHGWRLNGALVPLKDWVMVGTAMMLIALALQAIFRLLIGDQRKASLFNMVFHLMTLFYGDIQSLLNGLHFFSAYTGYRFLIPLLVLGLLALFILLRRSAPMTPRSTVFIRVLFPLLALTELWMAIATGHGQAETRIVGLRKPADIKDVLKPDIYLVLLDEYMGNDGLREAFGYDNDRFNDRLDSLGFRVEPHPRSLYFFTVYSMAGILNMAPVTDPSRQDIGNNTDYQGALQAIRNNRVCRILEDRGYGIHNLSTFDLPSAPSNYYNEFLPTGMRLLLYNTLWGHLYKDMPILLRGTGREGWVKGANEREVGKNEALLQECLDLAKSPTGKPRFTYLHLFMPHEPFARDSLGHALQVASRYPQGGARDSAYLGYLVWTNSRIIEFLKRLKADTKGDAVIILASDHGYRGRYKSGRPFAVYSTLQATYLPGANQQAQQSGTATNINLFRTLFAQLFGDSLPMVRDTATMPLWQNP